MLTIDQIESMNTSLTQITGVLGLIINVTSQGSPYENKQINNATWMVATVVKDMLSQLEAQRVASSESWEQE
jgi:hypothetical protein